MGDHALLSADTDKVKQYVFESDKLPEIRGASAILRDLNESRMGEKFMARGLSKSIVYAGGGSLLAIVPRSLAHEICQEIEELYVAETGVATITAVWAEIEEAEQQKQFGAAFQRIQYRLKRSKEARPGIPYFETAMHARRCAACGSRPASEKDPREFEDRWLCAPCGNKLRNGGSEKAGYAARFKEEISRQAGWPVVGYWNGHAEAERANDLREIAQAGHGERYIGFIYADGNGIGRRLAAARSREAFQGMSGTLNEAIPQAVFRALAEHSRVCKVRDEAGKDKHIHPWEIVALGGDDALLIVPGDIALQVAEAVCRHFAEQLHNAGWQDPPSMSAGVAITHEGNPIRFVRELAEQLLRSAKRRAHELKRAGSDEGAIDFAVLKSQSMLASDLETLRRQAYTATVGTREKLYLAGRPFSLTEMRSLLTQARALRDAKFPRAQMHLLREAVREAEHLGRPWTALRYHRQWERMRPSHKALLNEVEARWRSARPTSTLDLYPWLELQPKGGQQRAMAVWEDLHEIRELLPPGTEERHTLGDALEAFEQAVGHEEQRLRGSGEHDNGRFVD